MTNKLVKIVSLLVAFVIVVSGTVYASWANSSDVVPASERDEFFDSAIRVVFNRQVDAIETGKPLYFEILYAEGLSDKDAEILNKFKATFKVSRIEYYNIDGAVAAGTLVDASNYSDYSVKAIFTADDSSKEYVCDFHNIIWSSFKPVIPRMDWEPRSVYYKSNTDSTQEETQSQDGMKKIVFKLTPNGDIEWARYPGVIEPANVLRFVEKDTQIILGDKTYTLKAGSAFKFSFSNQLVIRGDVRDPYSPDEEDYRHLNYIDAMGSCIIKESVSIEKVKAPVTRIELANMLYNFDGNPAPPSVADIYKDIPVLEDVHKWALSTKIVLGNNKGEFMPDKQVTIQDAILMTYRYLKHYGKLDVFKNSTEGVVIPADTSDYAKEAVTFFIANHLTQHDAINSAKDVMTLERYMGIVAQIMHWIWGRY